MMYVLSYTALTYLLTPVAIAILSSNRFLMPTVPSGNGRCGKEVALPLLAHLSSFMGRLKPPVLKTTSSFRPVLVSFRPQLMTVPDTHIFIANSPWYTDKVDRPVKRLKEQLDLAFNSESSATTPVTISLPSDSTCVLTATKNVVGRYLNNQPSPSSHDVCTRKSDPTLTQGIFIHIEQAAVARNKAARGAWIQALKNTFAVYNPKI